VVMSLWEPVNIVGLLSNIQGAARPFLFARSSSSLMSMSFAGTNLKWVSSM
jgi:hypothetical protein